MTPQPGKPTMAIKIFPNISKNEGTHTMKFGQLTEYYVINIFLAKSYRKGGEEISPEPFLKNLNIDWINSHSLFLLYAIVESKLQITCFYLI